MASSGYFQNTFSTGYTLRVEWKTNSQNVAANTSNITVTAYLVSGGASYTVQSTAQKTISLTIDGSTYSKTASNLAALNGNQKKELFSKTVTITHGSDGTKSVDISCSFGIEVTLSGTYYSTVSANGTAALDRIAKSSVPTVSGTMAVGSEVTINTNRASTGFTHTLHWSVDQQGWTQIAQNVGASVSWTLPAAMATAKKASTSGVVYIRCTTYNSGLSIGTSTVSYKYYITAAYAAPTVLVSTSQTNTAAINEYIRGKSVLTLTAMSTMKYGATATKYVFTYGGTSKMVVSTASTASITVDLPADAAASYPYGVTVTDTRGYTASAAGTLTVRDYSSPVITSFTAVRGNLSTGGVFTAADDGESLKVTFAAQISSINSKNAKSYAVQYKLATSSSYTTAKSATASAYTVSETVYIDSAISANDSYNIKLAINDSFGSTFKILDIPTAFTLLDFHSGGKGLAVGKVAEKSFGFEVGMPMYDSYGMMFRSGLALYESGGATDANTTLEELFISQGTANNAPTNGFFFIRQMFYSTKSANANRAQYAIPYTAGGSHYRRNFNNGAWSKWYELPVIIDRGTNGVWTYEKLSNGYAECWGKVSISSTAVTTALGNWYRSAVLGGTALPLTFTSVPTFTMGFSTSASTGAMVWLTGAGSTTATPTLYLISPTSASAVSGTLNIYVRGTWA